MGGWRRSVGELVLIVVGVLIALTADQWIQARTDRASESQVLASVRSDLQAEISSLERALGLPSVDDSFRRVVADLEGTTPPDDVARFLTDLWSLGYFQLFQRRRATFANLVGSGTLDLISDDALAQSLVAYNGFIDATESHIQAWHDQLLEYRVVVHALAGPRIWAIVVDNVREGRIGYDSSREVLDRINVQLARDGLGLDWPRIAASSDLRAGLALVVDNRTMKSGLLSAYLTRAVELIGQLDASVGAL